MPVQSQAERLEVHVLLAALVVAAVPDRNLDRVDEGDKNGDGWTAYDPLEDVDPNPYPNLAEYSIRDAAEDLRQDVATLSTDLAGLKEQLAGGPPELDLQPVDIRAVEQAVGAIHAEVKAVTQATAEP